MSIGALNKAALQTGRQSKIGKDFEFADFLAISLQTASSWFSIFITNWGYLCPYHSTLQFQAYEQLMIC